MHFFHIVRPALLCKLPEDDDCFEIFRSKLMVKYLIYTILYTLVLIEFVNHLPTCMSTCFKLCILVHGESL